MRPILTILTLALATFVFVSQGAPKLGPELLVATLAACLVETMSVRQPRQGTLSFGLVLYAPIFALLGPSAALSIAAVALLVRETVAYTDPGRFVLEIVLELFPVSVAGLSSTLVRPEDPTWLSWLAFALLYASSRHLSANLLRRGLRADDLETSQRLARATADLRGATVALALLAIPLALQHPLLILVLFPVLYSFRKAAIHAYAHLDKEDKKMLRRHLQGAESQVGELSKTLETTQVQRNLLHELSKDTARCTTLVELLDVIERHARGLKLGDQLELLSQSPSGWILVGRDQTGKPRARAVDPSTLPPTYHQVWTTGMPIMADSRLYQLLPGTGVLSLRCGERPDKEARQIQSLFCNQISLASLSAMRLEILQRTLADLARANSELEAGNESLRVAMEQLRTSEAKLIESAKLAAVGQLSAGLAHEINNPLGSIRLGIESTLRKEQLSAFSKDMLEKGLAAVKRAEQVIGSLLNYSRTEGKGKVKVSALSVMNDTISFLGGALRLKGVTVDLPESAADATVLANPGEIQQILINLLLNAKDAVEGKDPARVALRLEVDGEKAHLEVHDNGPGLSPEVRARIFDPFFTTKPVGKGTGLGLSVSRQMAGANGGTLEALDSSSLGGAGFRVSLPLG